MSRFSQEVSQIIEQMVVDLVVAASDYSVELAAKVEPFLQSIAAETSAEATPGEAYTAARASSSRSPKLPPACPGMRN